MVFIFSLTLPDQSEKLLLMFYPIKEQLYSGLLIGALAIPPFLLTSFREKIWRFHGEFLFRLFKPMIFLGLLCDFAFMMLLANQSYWQFSWGIGLGILVNLVALYWLLTSRHLKVMLVDWRHRAEEAGTDL